ncbi:major outer membrane protein [Campylobacter sp. 9BO]|uniref:major outer membrane protein n=1 Tax=Campylobacter sp. 9BO TaxID=3424759 RepID=UPI003D33455F
MKLAKISLAALVALGAFSSVASATPLEEAIKNVDVSGFARYRYDNVKTKPYQEKSDTEANHLFRLTTDFKAAIDDNFFGVLGLRYNSKDNSANEFDKTDADGKFGVYQLYLGYKAQNTTITAGKQVIGSFFTDDEVGTGVKIVNQDIEGLTLVAAAFDALDYDTYEADGELLGHIKGEYSATKNNGDKVTASYPHKSGNLYMVGAIGSYDPIGFQLWYASLTDIVDIAAVEVTGNFAITDDVSVGFTANYAHASADSKAKKKFVTNAEYNGATWDTENKYNDGNFYAGELSTSLFGADVAAGYIGWKAKNHGVTSFTLEDNGALIAPGEETFDHTWASGKGSFWYGTVGYTFMDKFFVGADYIQGSIKGKDKKTKIKEVVPRLSYAYSEKLEFSSWYSYKEEKSGGDKEKQDKFRFEAKYSF